MTQQIHNTHSLLQGQNERLSNFILLSGERFLGSTTRRKFFVFHGGYQQSLAQLTQNLLKLLPSNKQALPVQQFIKDPAQLVNKRIEHLFDTEKGGLQWYNGTVISYNQCTKQQQVVYESIAEWL